MTTMPPAHPLTFPDEWRDLRVVLCHDWLTGMRGGERVLEILCEAFPSAPVMTLIHNREAISETINRHPIHTSFLQNVPGVMPHYRNLLPLFPAAIRSLKPPPADLMISTSHCVAKSLKPAPGTAHLCYCFTPMRYAWTFFDEYFGRSRAKRLAVRPLLAWLRRWDKHTAGGVDRFVAISDHVRQRINRFYDREADIVFPPVDTGRCTPGTEAPGSFDLLVSALVPYKRVDLAVKAYGQLGYPLKVVGVGGELAHLREQAGPHIEFLEWQSDEAVLTLYRTCRQLIFPGEEDFGIVPLEAQSCGKPVVAYGCGGALETVKADQTGVFFAEQTETSLLGAVERCASLPWDPALIRQHAESFSNQHFVDNLAVSISRTLSTAPADGDSGATDTRKC